MTGWTEVDVGDSSLTGAIDSGTKKLGSRSLKLIDTGTGEDDYYSTVVAGLSPLTTYVASAWVNVSAFTGPAILDRGLYAIARRSGGYDGATVSTSKLTAATPGWVRKSIVVTTGPFDREIELRLYAPAGTTYWDGVQLEPKSAAANA